MEIFPTITPDILLTTLNEFFIDNVGILIGVIGLVVGIVFIVSWFNKAGFFLTKFPDGENINDWFNKRNRS